jgi:hemoglobin/transferrin/lactoferrin receptor protein
LALLLAGAATVGVSPAAAQDDDALYWAERKRAITVTATRIPADVAEVPATVTVITAQDIADQMATDIKDLVRFEPGVTVPLSPIRFGEALGATGRAGNESFRSLPSAPAHCATGLRRHCRQVRPSCG